MNEQGEIRILELKRLISENNFPLSFLLSIPRASNIRCIDYPNKTNRLLVNTYKNYNPAELEIIDYIRISNLNSNCYLKLSSKQIDIIKSITHNKTINKTINKTVNKTINETMNDTEIDAVLV